MSIDTTSSIYCYSSQSLTQSEDRSGGSDSCSSEKPPITVCFRCGKANCKPGCIGKTIGSGNSYPAQTDSSSSSTYLRVHRCGYSSDLDSSCSPLDKDMEKQCERKISVEDTSKSCKDNEDLKNNNRNEDEDGEKEKHSNASGADSNYDDNHKWHIIHRRKRITKKGKKSGFGNQYRRRLSKHGSFKSTSTDSPLPSARRNPPKITRKKLGNKEPIKEENGQNGEKPAFRTKSKRVDHTAKQGTDTHKPGSSKDGKGKEVMVCYKCNQPGHCARRCTNTGGSILFESDDTDSAKVTYQWDTRGLIHRKFIFTVESSDDEQCTRCKGRGHSVDNCTKIFISCYICKEAGHFGQDCPRTMLSTGAVRKRQHMKPKCQYCYQTGHSSKYCPFDVKPCRSGYIRRDCYRHGYGK